MPSKSRILLVQTQGENAGAQEISRLVGAGLVARGYDVHSLFFYQKSESFDAPPNTVFAADHRPGDPVSFVRFLVSLGRRIRQTKPDAIVTFQHYGNAIGGAVARLVSPAPVIANQVSPRWTMKPWLRAIDLAMGMLGVFKCITVNSFEMMRDYSRFPSRYRKRVQHVPHGFDHKTADVAKPAARASFGLDADAVILGSVARLHPWKQLDAAIRVLPLRPDWLFAVVGQGPEEARLRQLAAELGVADRVHFLGEIAPDEIGRFLACLDVFVFPSEAETFGLAAVEAASAGVPVVANDLSILREVLAYKGEPAALFVDATQPAAFAATISRVIDDPALAETLRRNARGLRERYSIDAMVDDYVRIIESAI